MDSLPKELHSVIVSFVDAKSRRALRLASTHWFNTTNMRDFVFNFETEEELREILQHLKKYSQPIGVEFKSSKNRLPANHLIDEISQLTNVTMLYSGPIHFDTKVPLEALLPLTKLANLQDEDFLTSDFPPEIVRHFSNLRTIYLETIEYAEQLNLTRFTQLEDVKFSGDSLLTSDPLLIIPHTNNITSMQIIKPLGVSAMNEANLTRFSKLKELWIQDRKSQLHERLFTMPYLPYLEELGFFMEQGQIGNFSAVYSTLTSLLTAGKQYDTNNLAALTKLKSISLTFIGCSINVNESTFWTALTNLETIEVHTRSTNWDWTQLLQFLSSTRVTSLYLSATCKLDPLLKLCGTLQNLTLHHISPPQNQLKFFTNLTQLKTLSVTADMLPVFETLTKLKRLELYPLSESDLGILRLDNLKELESFTFHDDRFRIDTTSWQHLPLKYLSLNWIDDEVLISLLPITTLESLSVVDASALDNDSIAMLTTLSNLTILDLGRVTYDIHRTLLQNLNIKWRHIIWEDGKHESLK